MGVRVRGRKIGIRSGRTKGKEERASVITFGCFLSSLPTDAVC